MRLLHVTDTHLGVDRWFRGAPRGWRRADDHASALRTALAAAGEVDLVVHTGDLFDRSRPPARAVAEARALLANLGVPLLLLPGNHDRRGLAGHFPGGIPGATIVDRPATVRLAGIDVAVVPWAAEATSWAAQARALGGDLLVCHQSFHGARVPGFTFRSGHHAETVGAHQVPRRFPVVLCGHIHPRQVLTLGESVVVHPGSAERTSFSERGETKGYAVVEVGTTTTWQFVDLPSRPMRVVTHEADVEGVAPGELVSVRDPRLDDAVLARGGWVPPRRAESRQVGLFGGGV